jgi:hypothetical protein
MLGEVVVLVDREHGLGAEVVRDAATPSFEDDPAGFRPVPETAELLDPLSRPKSFIRRGGHRQDRAHICGDTGQSDTGDCELIKGVETG